MLTLRARCAVYDTAIAAGSSAVLGKGACRPLCNPPAQHSLSARFAHAGSLDEQSLYRKLRLIARLIPYRVVL